VRNSSSAPAENSAALGESELRYRRLFEAAHDGILLVNPRSRKIVDANPFLVGFLGYTRDELIGKELFEIGLLADEAASQEAFRELQSNGLIRYEDLPLKTKGGRTAEVEFVSNLYEEGDQQIIQCNIRDITARKRVEAAGRAVDLTLARRAADLDREVDDRTRELRLAQLELETLIHSIAHDLRAPLRTMQGFSQLLVQRHAAALNSEGREFARFIDSAAQTMDSLLADLLEFSRISRQAMHLVSLSLEAMIEGALADCTAVLRERDVRVERAISKPTVLAHAATLRQVLVNLIENAVKFNASSAPTLRFRTEERPGDILRLWVEDNGIGIPLESQQRIYQVFQRLHTTAYPGTGIGLAIVQKGIERMGGRVGVVSAVGAGSQFWIELAQAPGPRTGP
jgi:PAS domain S-box-containing protein